jgi:hypothetical protein
LCANLINRNLSRIEIQNQPFSKDTVDAIKKDVREHLSLDDPEVDFFVITDSISNNAYSQEDEHIRILYHGGMLRDISEVSDMLDISVLSKTILKYFLYYPKESSG